MRLRPSYLALLCILCAAVPARGEVHKPLPPPGHLRAAPAASAEKEKTVAAKVGPVLQKNKKGLHAAKDDDEALPPAPDLDEGLPLPSYPSGARHAMGKATTWETGEEDTLLDVARHFDLGYVEMRAANPDVDAWAPLPGTEITIPSFRLLPRATQEGIVVNLAEMRMYYFKTPGAEPETLPIGIGRDGLMTPTGTTEIIRKAAGPTWYPTPRMRQEHPYLPEAVDAGPMNPLGTHALYLGWSEFRIHGSNKPWAIGRRVSSGCMRLYPEDIIRLFNETPVGTKVTVVEQPILAAWVGRQLYLEANPSRVQSNELEIDGEFKPKDLTEPLKKVIAAVGGRAGEKIIDWKAVEKAVHERRGVPVLIADLDSDKKPAAPSPPKKSGPARYN